MGQGGEVVPFGFARKDRVDDGRMALRQHLPGALPLSVFNIGANRVPGLCIGFGSAEVDQITKAVRALGAAVRLSPDAG